MRGKERKSKNPVNVEGDAMKNELTNAQKQDLREAFSSFEETGITPEEIKCAMKTLGFDKNNQEVAKIIEKIDQRKGPIDFDNFLDIMMEKNNEKNSAAEMQKAFNILSEEGTNKITLKSLSKICSDLGEKMTEEEIKDMLNEANREQDDEITQEDFFKVMQKIGMF